jgi:hypothetical protein
MSAFVLEIKLSPVNIQLKNSIVVLVSAIFFTFLFIVVGRPGCPTRLHYFDFFDLRFNAAIFFTLRKSPAIAN